MLPFCAPNARHAYCALSCVHPSRQTLLTSYRLHRDDALYEIRPPPRASSPRHLSPRTPCCHVLCRDVPFRSSHAPARLYNPVNVEGNLLLIKLIRLGINSMM